MTLYLAIAIGGSLGAVCRYWVSTTIYAWLGTGFPYGTLMVNLSGSFMMGLLVVLLAEKFTLSQRACNRTLRVARSIADMAGEELVTQTHIAEALSFRVGN